MTNQNQRPDQDVDQDSPVIESFPPRQPWANVRLDQYDRRRETIGRGEFLQLRLPLDGLLSVDEIEEVLGAARESNPGYEGEHQAREAPLGRAFSVRDPQPSRTNIRRQPRTRYTASPLGGAREDDEKKKEKAKVKVRRSKLSWRYFGSKLFGNKDKKDDDEGKGPHGVASVPVSVMKRKTR